jgi:hypothetical protein
LALLISGDVVRLGWPAFGLWHFIFPYFWLFLLLGSLRARRRVSEGTVFLAGATMAMLYGGIYAKDLQHGYHPMGIDWLGVLCTAFDGGMIAVLALHLVSRIRPCMGEEAELITAVFLTFTLGAAVVVYGIKTAFNFYRAERMLGPTWLLADLLFAWGAWVLGRRAWDSIAADDVAGRESWVWGLGAFAVWLPGARIVARICAAIELPGALLYFFVGAFTCAVFWLARQLWREREHFDSTEQAVSKYATIAASWRVAGSLLMMIWLREDLNDARAPGVFATFIDLPTRALFTLSFLTARLKV